MKFAVRDSKSHLDFILTYAEDDYAFDVEPRLESGFTSIMVNDLQLEIDEEGQIMYAWGYCPLIEYEETSDTPEHYRSCSLFAILEDPSIPGVSYRVNEDQRWPIYINQEKGWVCIGNPETKSKQLIEFAPHCIAAIEGNEMNAIWLHPKELPFITLHKM